jgi:multiple sugar transport system permease protein
MFIIPALVVLAVVVLFPVGWGIRISFDRWNWNDTNGMLNRAFAGLDNYKAAFNDVFFLNALKNTGFFSFVAVIIEFIIGLTCALLLNAITQPRFSDKLSGLGSLLFRTMLMFPLMLPDIVVALMWKMLLNPSMGPINKFVFSVFHITPDWIGNASLVVPVLSVVDAWWQTGNIMLIILAGLQSIPYTLIEVARCDGATILQRFRYIIIPHIKPFIFMALYLRLIDLFRVFSLSWAISGGGPGRASEMVQQYIYTQGMGKYMQIGYSNALSVIYTIIVVGAIFFIMRLSNRSLVND